MKGQKLEAVPRSSWLALGLAALTYTVISITLTGTNIAFPAITDEFSGTSRATLSWALSGYSIALATFMVPAGRLSDRRGRKRMFFAGVWLFLAASLICLVAPTANVFVAGRILQGVGGSLTVPTSLALVLPGFPAGRRTSAVAAWTASGTVGAAIAPSLSALIVENFGWRYIYLLAVPVAAVVLVGGRTLLSESEPIVDGKKLDLVGFPMGTIAIGLVAFVIVQAPGLGWGHVAIVAALGWRRLLAAAVRGAFATSSCTPARPAGLLGSTGVDSDRRRPVLFDARRIDVGCVAALPDRGVGLLAGAGRSRNHTSTNLRIELRAALWLPCGSVRPPTAHCLWHAFPDRCNVDDGAAMGR